MGWAGVLGEGEGESWWSGLELEVRERRMADGVGCHVTQIRGDDVLLVLFF